jgi:hypothetical protein
MDESVSKRLLSTLINSFFIRQPSIIDHFIISLGHHLQPVALTSESTNCSHFNDLKDRSREDSDYLFILSSLNYLEWIIHSQLSFCRDCCKRTESFLEYLETNDFNFISVFYRVFQPSSSDFPFSGSLRYKTTFHA